MTDDMINNLPDEVSKRDFQKVFRGYDPAAVDDYINLLTENYSSLYREYAELEHKLALALERLAKLDGEEEKVKKTLDTARLAADKIVSDAYERSDAILASIKKSCDQILRSFRDKIEAQKTALSNIQENIFGFKNELFEKYRLHIELIEQLTPVFEYEQELSPEQYVEKVVSDMNREVSAEYGITLSGFEELETESEKKTENVSSDTLVFDSEPQIIPSVTDPAETEEQSAPKPKKSGRKSKKSAVIKLLDEYETPGASSKEAAGEVQMRFDFDSATDVLCAGK